MSQDHKMMLAVLKNAKEPLQVGYSNNEAVKIYIGLDDKFYLMFGKKHHAFLTLEDADKFLVEAAVIKEL